MQVRAIVVLCLVSMFSACGSSQQQGVSEAEVTQCLDPRPQICTLDYRPVCAVLADASRVEFSNGCSACSNPEVTGWVADACGN